MLRSSSTRAIVGISLSRDGSVWVYEPVKRGLSVTCPGSGETDTASPSRTLADGRVGRNTLRRPGKSPIMTKSSTCPAAPPEQPPGGSANSGQEPEQVNRE